MSRIIMEWDGKLYVLMDGANCPRCPFKGRTYCNLHGKSRGQGGHCNRASLEYTGNNNIRSHWELLQ